MKSNVQCTAHPNEEWLCLYIYIIYINISRFKIWLKLKTNEDIYFSFVIKVILLKLNIKLSDFNSSIVTIASFEAFRALKQHTNPNQGTCPNKQEMLLYVKCNNQSLEVGAEIKYNNQVQIKGHE